jgi:hypothetical protein
MRAGSKTAYRPYVPDMTLNAPDPHRIKVPGGHVRPDEAPILLRYRGLQLFLLGNEIDRGTEPLTTTHASRRNIKQKHEGYRQLFDGRLYRSHYNFPNSLVLFVFTNKTRMESAMELQEADIRRKSARTSSTTTGKTGSTNAHSPRGMTTYSPRLAGASDAPTSCWRNFGNEIASSISNAFLACLTHARSVAHRFAPLADPSAWVSFRH